MVEAMVYLMVTDLADHLVETKVGQMVALMVEMLAEMMAVSTVQQLAVMTDELMVVH